MYTRLSDIVAESAHRYPDAPAITHGETTLTYGELWKEVAEFAAGLVDLGIERGDRVGIYLEKRIETVVAIFAVSAAGGVFVPVNPVLRPQQVGHILANAGARSLVTTPQRLAQLGAALESAESLVDLILAGEGIETSDDHRTTSWEDLRASGGNPPIDIDLIDADIAAILYTSGSTGSPKGVVLSHRNLVVGAQSVVQYLENDSNDVILAVLPLSFDAGFSQLTTAFIAGAHVVLMNYLLAADVVRLCAEHGVTGLTCVPPLWIQLVEQKWPKEATFRMRYFANTGGRMPAPVLGKLRDTFPNARPYLMYGLTEAFRSTYLDPAEVDRRPDSIGKAIPNAEILVVRPDGSPCDPGEPGELVHRGALVSLGYWNDPLATGERFKAAPGQPAEVPTTELAVWSGDTVVRDEEGFLSFVGRTDDMIKTSGYRVSPTEIEEAVYATGLVRVAAAFGFPDERLGQAIVIVVSPSDAEEFNAGSLLATLRRALPPYMVPAKVVTRPDLPRSANGKIDRNRLLDEIDVSQ